VRMSRPKLIALHSYVLRTNRTDYSSVLWGLGFDEFKKYASFEGYQREYPVFFKVNGMEIVSESQDLYCRACFWKILCTGCYGLESNLCFFWGSGFGPLSKRMFVQKNVFWTGFWTGRTFFLDGCCNGRTSPVSSYLLHVRENLAYKIGTKAQTFKPR